MIKWSSILKLQFETRQDAKMTPVATIYAIFLLSAKGGIAPLVPQKYTQQVFADKSVCEQLAKDLTEGPLYRALPGYAVVAVCLPTRFEVKM